MADKTTSPDKSTMPGNVTAPLRSAIAGVSGYAGGELARLLLRHPRLADCAPMFLGRAAGPSTESHLLTDLHPQLATSGASPEVVPFHWQSLVSAGIKLLSSLRRTNNLVNGCRLPSNAAFV